MTNAFFNRIFNPLPGQRVDEQSLKDEFQRIEQGFDGVETAVSGLGASLTSGLALKANLAGGNVWSGPQDYTGGTLTVAAPTLPGHAATKQFVEQIAFSTALPGIAGNAGKQLGTNGSIVLWEAKDLPTLTGGDVGKVVVVGAGPAYTLAASIISPLVRVARTSNTIFAAADKGSWIDITSGTFTQTFSAAATLGNGWRLYLENSGTGDITLDPNASETIDGLTSFIMYPGERRLIQCDGSVLRSTVQKAFRRVYTSSSTFTKPPGYTYFGLREWGGGGGGSNCGGGGGACVELMILASAVGVTQGVTVGSGGAKNTAGGVATNGSSSSFAGTTAYGGAGANSSTTGGPGGGYLGAGVSGSNTQGAPLSSTIDNQFGGATGATGGVLAGNSVLGGGGGGSTGTSFKNGGNSVFGGGGGGGSDGASSTGGTSVYGGAGGNGGVTATAGTAPGGGGGGAIPGTGSADGARGEVQIWGVM